MYSQNYQVAISQVHQLRVQILEFRVEWTYLMLNDATAELEMVYIKSLAGKELYLTKNEEGNYNNISDIDLTPLLNHKNNDIVGTQLILQ